MKIDLNTKKGYDIASAIRGPDNNTLVGHHLKMVTTCVVRHLAGLKREKVRSMVNTPEIAKEFWAALAPEYRKAVARAWYEDLHFSAHVMDALDALADEGISGALGYKAWFLENLGDKVVVVPFSKSRKAVARAWYKDLHFWSGAR
jgi:hypothetical protein